MYLFNTNIIWCTHIHAHVYICLKKITLNYKQTKKICFRGITLESRIFTYATQSVSFFCKTHISETVLIVLIDWVTIPISRDTSYSASFTWTKSVGVCVCVIQYEFVCLCVCVCVCHSVGGKKIHYSFFRFTNTFSNRKENLITVASGNKLFISSHLLEWAYNVTQTTNNTMTYSVKTCSQPITWQIETFPFDDDSQKFNGFKWIMHNFSVIKFSVSLAHLVDYNIYSTAYVWMFFEFTHISNLSVLYMDGFHTCCTFARQCNWINPQLNHINENPTYFIRES